MIGIGYGKTTQNIQGDAISPHLLGAVLDEDIVQLFDTYFP
jgi:hypothetical protein